MDTDTTLQTTPNKQRLQQVFAALATGDGKPFVDCMAEDFCWTILGSTSWSRSFRGKQAVREQLLRPLFAQFATRYTNTAHRFIAEGDCVVVECEGRVTTHAGRPYNNRYCYICRLENGQLKELTEYFDSALVNAALEPLAPAA